MAREASPGAARIKDMAKRATEARRIAAHCQQRNIPVPEGVSGATLEYCKSAGIPFAESAERVGKNGERLGYADLGGDKVVDNMTYTLLKNEGAILKRDDKQNLLTIEWPEGVAEKRREDRINRHVNARNKFSNKEGDLEQVSGKITDGLLEELDKHLHD
jgi:hypothetical protein